MACPSHLTRILAVQDGEALLRRGRPRGGPHPRGLDARAPGGCATPAVRAPRANEHCRRRGDARLCAHRAAGEKTEANTPSRTIRPRDLTVYGRGAFHPDTLGGASSMLRALARHAGRATGASAALRDVTGATAWTRWAWCAAGGSGWAGVANRGDRPVFGGSAFGARHFHASGSSLAKPGRIKPNALLQPHALRGAGHHAPWRSRGEATHGPDRGQVRHDPRVERARGRGAPHRAVGGRLPGAWRAFVFLDDDRHRRSSSTRNAKREESSNAHAFTHADACLLRTDTRRHGPIRHARCASSRR